MKYLSIKTFLLVTAFIISFSSCTKSEVGEWVHENNNDIILTIESDKNFKYQKHGMTYKSGHYEKSASNKLTLRGKWLINSNELDVCLYGVYYMEDEDYIRADCGKFVRN